MCANIGKYERISRVILGLVLLVVAFNNYVSGVLNYVIYFLGVVLFLTGITGWCGLYALLGFSSKGQAIDKITRKDIEMAVKNSSFSTSEESLNEAKAPPAPAEPVVAKKTKKKSVKKSSKKKVAKKSVKKASKKAKKKTAKK